MSTTPIKHRSRGALPYGDATGTKRGNGVANDSPSSRSRTPELRRQFWQGFKEHMQTSHNVGCARATSDGWMWHTTSLTSGKLLSIARVNLEEVGVKYTLQGVAADSIFSLLQAHRDEFDAFFHIAPHWRKGGDSSHIIEIRHAGDILNPGTWPEQFNWLQAQLDHFYNALWPIVGRECPPAGKRNWDEGSFMDEVRRWNPNSTEPIQALLSWATLRGIGIAWSRGQQCGTFQPTVRHRGFEYHPLVVRVNGTFTLLFTHLRESPAFYPPELRQELRRRLNEIEHVALPEETIDLRPTLPLALLSTPASRDHLFAILDWFTELATRP